MINKTVGIYKITSPKNKIYIGQSWNIQNRLKAYSGCHCVGQKSLYNSIKKYGWENHFFEVIHELPEDIEQSIIDQYEILYYDFYKDLGFSMLNIKNPGSRGKHSEYTKLKMKKPKPIGFGEKVRDRQLGVKRHDCVDRMKSDNNPMKNKSIIKKISGSNHYKAKSVIGYTKKGEKIGEWQTIKEAADFLNIKSSGIIRCCKGIRKTVSNYTFTYAQ
jgi:group I intron endonuclease